MSEVTERPFNALSDDALEDLVYQMGDESFSDAPGDPVDDSSDQNTTQTDKDEEETPLDEESGTDEEVPNESDEDTDEEELDDSEALDDKESEEQTKDEDEDINKYKETYEKLFAPLKASGKTVNIESVDEARKLMSFGIDYHKNMNKISKHKAVLKTLEKEGLLDDKEQLNLLLEIKAGNKDALKQIIKKNNLEVDELDLVEDSEEKPYTPKDHIVSEDEVKVSEVIERIKDTPEFSQTMKLVTETWDEKSKQEIVRNPDILEVINIQIGNGDFDKINAELERAKLFGEIPQGMSDVDAYGLIASKVLSGKAENPKKGASTKSKKPSDKRRVAPPNGARRGQSSSQLLNKPFRELTDEELDKILEELN